MMAIFCVHIKRERVLLTDCAAKSATMATFSVARVRIAILQLAALSKKLSGDLVDCALDAAAQ